MGWAPLQFRATYCLFRLLSRGVRHRRTVKVRRKASRWVLVVSRLLLARSFISRAVGLQWCRLVMTVLNSRLLVGASRSLLGANNNVSGSIT